MRIDWRALFGPVMTATTSLAAIVADHSLLAVPNPAPLQVCIVAIAAALSGVGPGLISAVIAVATTAVFLLHHGPIPGLDGAKLIRLTLLAATASTTAIVTGMLSVPLTPWPTCTSPMAVATAQRSASSTLSLPSNIFTLPIKSATKRLAGCSYTSSGEPT